MKLFNNKGGGDEKAVMAESLANRKYKVKIQINFKVSYIFMYCVQMRRNAI